MNEEQLLIIIGHYVPYFTNYAAVRDAVREYSQSLTAAKPIVSGSLPPVEVELEALKCKVMELLLYTDERDRICNGFRTIEVVQELRKMAGGNDR